MADIILDIEHNRPGEEDVPVLNEEESVLDDQGTMKIRGTISVTRMPLPCVLLQHLLLIYKEAL